MPAVLTSAESDLDTAFGITPGAKVSSHAAPPVNATPRVDSPLVRRAFACRCGRPVFFRNSACLACGAPLGYDPALGALLPLQRVETPSPLAPDWLDASDTPAASAPLWRADGSETAAPRYLRCANLNTAAACNWLLVEHEVPAGSPLLCRCCRLTRTVPNLSVPPHDLWWKQIELAKRRLVSSLIGLNLPVRSKAEDPVHGLAFDLLRSLPGAPPVVTGHEDGVVTLDIEEADDAWREQRRAALFEPYRTLLGHLRHETGHYYWQLLIDAGPWLARFRELFGDERQDYAAALQRHYAQGAPSDWGLRFVSSYASSHPWEDWAETWAHYLHLRDTLDTARSFGLDGEQVEIQYERFAAEDVAIATVARDDSCPDNVDGHDACTAGTQDFLRLMNSWMELTGDLNELSRSMGVPDFYPFVLSVPAVRKLLLVHCVVIGGRP